MPMQEHAAAAAGPPDIEASQARICMAGTVHHDGYSGSSTRPVPRTTALRHLDGTAIDGTKTLLTYGAPGEGICARAQRNSLATQRLDIACAL